jgi:hypothetical protein
MRRSVRDGRFLKRSGPAEPSGAARIVAVPDDVTSEVRQGGRRDTHVSAWYAPIGDEDRF